MFQFSYNIPAMQWASGGHKGTRRWSEKGWQPTQAQLKAASRGHCVGYLKSLHKLPESPWGCRFEGPVRCQEKVTAKEDCKERGSTSLWRNGYWSSTLTFITARKRGF